MHCNNPSGPQQGEGKARHAWHIALRIAQMMAAASAGAFVFLRRWRAQRDSPDALSAAVGAGLVRACTDLGATFIKIGQVASTRGDILPRPLALELSRLQDQVPPFAFAEVRRTIEGDLGKPLEELFRDFAAQPLAAASVAQVHRAVWRQSGEPVAIKVRRPDILAKIRLDRSILLATARVLERLIPSVRLISLEDAIRNFCAAVEEQIHLTNEAEHNRRFAANFADDDDIHFPKLIDAACSDSVLTMELIDGIREAELDSSNVDPLAVARAGLRCVCRMIFSHGFVHADLHPGNMRFFAPHRVVLLDLGLVGSLLDEDRLSLAQTLYAFATGDGKTVARLFYENAPHKATPDYTAYEREIVDMVSALQQRGLGNLQVSLEIGRIFDILRRHHIRARSHMTMVNLALMTAEGLGKRLAPQLSLTDEALPYLAEALAGSTRAEPR